MLIELEDTETVVSQEMVRHDSISETASPDTAVEAEETEGQDGDTETRDGWLAGWKLPVLSDVVNKTSSVVQQTVQQTSNVVCSYFALYDIRLALLLLRVVPNFGFGKSRIRPFFSEIRRCPAPTKFLAGFARFGRYRCSCSTFS